MGFALFMQAGQAVVDNRLQPGYAGDSLLTTVRVIDFPRRTGGSVVMTVAPLTDQRLPPRSRVTWFEPRVMPQIGDVWEFELRLRQPRGNSNPGVFDYEAWMFRTKIHATGYVVNGKRNRLLRTATGPFSETFRREFVARAGVAADSRASAAVLAAVGVGARHLISERQWEHYALSGTSHLMAISGLHIGLAASVAFLLAGGVLGALRVCDNSFLVAIAVSVLVAAGYAAISGLGVPAQRATLMLVLSSIAVVRRRHIEPPAIIATVAMTVYSLDPIATMTPGFNLSFGAVVLLLWLARRSSNANGAASAPGRIANRLRQLVHMQVFLMFGLMPLTVLIFQRIAYLAVPVNLLAVPLFSVVTVPLVLAGMALACISESLGESALRVAAKSVDWLEKLIGHVVSLPYADITVASIAGHNWLLVVLPALWVVLPKGWPGRWLGFLGVAALLLHAPQVPDDRCFDAHILDVGQGLAVVMQTQNSVLVFDTGASFRGGGSAAEQVVIPFLKSKSIRSIDWLLVSHADVDHSGGYRPLKEYAEIATTLVGEPLPDAARSSIACGFGQTWTADGVRFSVLHPGAGSIREGNDASCVLLADAGGYRMLLTGDIETGAEREILQRNMPGAVDIVVVPHHGSLTSSSTPFVDTLSPTLAVVSAGHGNRWGFPKTRVVERWQSVGAEVLDTAGSGAVSLRVCAERGLYALHRDRNERRRFWRGAGD